MAGRICIEKTLLFIARLNLIPEASGYRPSSRRTAHSPDHDPHLGEASP